MKFQKVLAGVLMVLLICCLMISYAGSSVGIPPTEEELLAQSHSIRVMSDKKVVYPDEEGAWEYQLTISPEGSIGFTLKRTETFCSDRGFYGPLSPHEEAIQISPAQARKFNTSLSLAGGNELPAEYHDHIFLGVDDKGNEVKGTIRIYFAKSEE